MDDYSYTTSCDKLGKQRKISGLWIIGFEISLFKDNKVLSNRDEGYAQLIVPEQLDKIAHSRDSLGQSMYNVAFIGRDSLEPDRSTVVLDRLLSMEVQSSVTNNQSDSKHN